ncbi:hypothetical protein C5167_028906 [Papaver somniferum]|nr:hypothetical protein C5167_028906 [Papaver somniferum]
MDAEEEIAKGQAEIWEHVFAFADSMALKCAVELGIPDIINSHGHPVTVLEIINSLKTTTSSSSPNIDYLTRVMRLLVPNCTKENGLAFEKAHGCKIWDMAVADPHFNQVFNDGMGCTAKMIVNMMLTEYKDGFNDIGSLVDVGGGKGAMIAAIVEANPHVKGINFDLPHVLATAQEHPGVTHVTGDMFVEIPEADAVIMKTY